MVAVFGLFSGTLDEKHELRARAYVRTASTHVVARYFRIKLISPRCHVLYGRVSADIHGAESAIERIAFPEYEDLWTRRGVPSIPEKFASGHVRVTTVDLCRCFPEYQSCDDDCEANPLAIEPDVPSVGFIVEVRLSIAELRPGSSMRGMVALSDGDRSARQGHGNRDVDASPAKNGTDLSDVAVAGDDTAGIHEGRAE